MVDPTEKEIRLAIDALSEGVAAGGTRTPITDFLINYLTLNVAGLKEAKLRWEEWDEIEHANWDYLDNE